MDKFLALFCGWHKICEAPKPASKKPLKPNVAAEKVRLFFGQTRFQAKKPMRFPRQIPRKMGNRKFPTSRSGKSGKKRENLTSPNTSPEHISGFQNMLFVCRKPFYSKDLKIHPTGFEPVTFGSVDLCAIESDSKSN